MSKVWLWKIITNTIFISITITICFTLLISYLLLTFKTLVTISENPNTISESLTSNIFLYLLQLSNRKKTRLCLQGLKLKWLERHTLKQIVETSRGQNSLFGLWAVCMIILRDKLSPINLKQWLTYLYLFYQVNQSYIFRSRLL